MQAPHEPAKPQEPAQPHEEHPHVEEGPRGMDPHTRLSIALLGSLVLWWPTMQQMLDGEMDPLESSLRWVVAFTISSVALRILTGLVEAYAAAQEDEEKPSDTDQPQAPASGLV